MPGGSGSPGAGFQSHCHWLAAAASRGGEFRQPLAGAEGPLRVYSLPHRARPALLGLGAPGTLDRGPWADRVQLVEAECDGAWEPVIGAVAAPGGVLIRPDGHVAWVGDGTEVGLADALGHWFGPAGAGS